MPTCKTCKKESDATYRDRCPDCFDKAVAEHRGKDPRPCIDCDGITPGEFIFICKECAEKDPQPVKGSMP